MNEHISGICMEQGDLTYILPLVQQTLKTIMSFETLHWFPSNGMVSLQNTTNETDMTNALFAGTKLFGLSERQQKRLKEAMNAKQPFWDTIGHNVFLPMQDICHCGWATDKKTVCDAHTSQPQGILVLKGVNRLINIEEAGRWLPLLQQYIQLLVQEIFQHAMIPQKDADEAVYSPFLQYFLKKMQSDGASTAIVHVSQIHRPSELEWDTTTWNTTSFCSKAQAVCLRLWPNVRLKYLGGDRFEAWFAVLNKNHTSHQAEAPPLKYDSLASGLKRFWQSVPCSVAKNLSIYLHFDKNNPLSIPFIIQTEFLARQLKTNLFSSKNMALLQQRIGAQYLSEALQRIALLPDRIQAAAFVSGGSGHETGIEKIKAYLPDFLQLIPSSHKSAFMVSHTKIDDALVQHIEKAVLAIPELEHTVMGIAFDDAILKAAGISSPAIAAVYAYLHASLLSESHFHKDNQSEQSHTIKKAVFDALTLHVAGDELFAMGDMETARRMFQKALTLELRKNRQHGNEQKWSTSVVTPALLNSLGITLLQTGKRAAAVRYFKQALQQFPEDVMAYYNLSGILLETKQFDKAEALLRKAAQLAPEDIHITIKLANCLFEKQNTNAALSLLAPFMTKGQVKLPTAFFKLQGRLGLEKGNWSYAKESLNKALVRTPYDAEILFFLAKGYLTIENDSKTALRLLKQAELLTSSKKLYKMIVDLKRKTENTL